MACPVPFALHTHLLPSADCLSFPHVIHAAFSIASGVVFFLVAFLLVSPAVAMVSFHKQKG